MLLFYIFTIVFITLGITSLFRPVLLIFLFATLPVLSHIPVPPGYDISRMLSVGSINIHFYDFLVILLFINLAFSIKKYPDVRRMVFSSAITKMIFVIIIWGAIIGVLSLMQGYQLQNVLRNLSKEFVFLIAIFMPMAAVRDENYEKFYKYMILIAVIIVGLGVWRYGVAHDPIMTSSGTKRYLQANAITMILFPLCYVLFYKIHTVTSKSRYILYTSLFVLGIILSGYRSGWIVLALVIAIYLFSKDVFKVSHLWVHFLGVTLFIATIWVSVSVTNITPGSSLWGDVIIRVSDTFDMENKTTVGRLSRWGYSLEVLERNPFVGLGRYPVYSAHVNEDLGNEHLSRFSEMERGAHNAFVSKIIHEGLLGFGVLIMFLYVIFRTFRLLDCSDKRYLNALKVYVVAFIAFSLFNTSFESTSGRTLFVVTLGLLNIEFVKNYKKRLVGGN